jgi:hypothetical protein
MVYCSMSAIMHACLSRWLFFMGQNGLSGGFFADEPKVVPQFSCTAVRRLGQKRAKNLAQ